MLHRLVLTSSFSRARSLLDIVAFWVTFLTRIVRYEQLPPDAKWQRRSVCTWRLEMGDRYWTELQTGANSYASFARLRLLCAIIRLL